MGISAASFVETSIVIETRFGAEGLRDLVKGDDFDETDIDGEES